MSIDIKTLALAKSYADKVVGVGINNGKIAEAVEAYMTEHPVSDGYEWHTIPYSIFSWDVSNVPGNETITDWDGLKAVTIPGETTVAMGRLLFNIQNLFTQGPSSMNSGVLDKAKSIATAYLAIRDAGIFNNTVAFVVKSGTQKHHYELAYRSDKNVLTIFERFMDRNADALGINIDTDEITQEDIDHNFMWTMKYVDATKVPIPETASIGQVLSVKSVDENGKPTEWETTDIPEVATDECVLELLSEMGIVTPLAASDGSVYTDSNGNVYVL